jgi:hypothetical protein
MSFPRPLLGVMTTTLPLSFSSTILSTSYAQPTVTSCAHIASQFADGKFIDSLQYETLAQQLLACLNFTSIHNIGLIRQAYCAYHADCISCH